MTRKLLITGAVGFIGFNFLKYLVRDPDAILKRYDLVVSVDKMGYATKYNEIEYHKLCAKHNILDVKQDLNRIHNCIFTLHNDDKWDVVDFASNSHVDNSISAPYQSFTQNSNLTANIIEYLGGVDRINHFYHASTDEVYGELSYDLVNGPRESWFSEDTQLHPNNPYSASKVAQDAFLMSMGHTFELKYTLFRMANQFGPHQHPEKMMPASILRALKGEPIKIYGEGKNVRQWTPVADTVSCLYDMIVGEGMSNSGRGNVKHFAHPARLMNNNEVVDVWRKILKDDFQIDTKIEYIEDRKGHDTVYALANGSYGDMYSVDLETRFRQTIKHYIDNSKRYGV